MKKSVVEMAKKLEGISYDDWKLLQYTINRAFALKKGELEKELKLSSADDTVTRVLSE